MSVITVNDTDRYLVVILVIGLQLPEVPEARPKYSRQFMLVV
ncbi:hypothetical protein [Trichothermofontia sp.]